MTRLSALLVSVLLLATGCATEAPEVGAVPSPSVTTAGAPSPSPARDPGAPSPAVPSPSITPDAYGSLDVDLAGAGARPGTLEGPDGTRTFAVHLPDTGSADAPLLVALHGFTQGSVGFETYTGLVAAATSRGVVAVTPDGVEDSWNGGLSCCPPATRRGIDDVGFLRALASGLVAELDLDPDRVWAVGFSNGGFLALRLACDAPDVFTALVSHAGTMDLPCEPDAPTSVLLSHGTEDTLIPFDDGRGPVSPQATGRGARAVFAAWRELGGCPEPEPRASHADEDLLAAPCDDGTAVGLAVWDGVGHVWPADLNDLLLDWLEADAERRS